MRISDWSSDVCSSDLVVPCDIFVTEATFGLPVFRHPPTGDEIAKLLAAVGAEPDRCVLVGAYALGKAQRVIAELRAAGWDAPISIPGPPERESEERVVGKECGSKCSTRR